MMEERLRGCELTVLNACFSGLQASAVDGTEKRFDTTVWLVQTQLTGKGSFHTVSKVSVVRNLTHFSPSTPQLEEAASNYGIQKNFLLRACNTYLKKETILTVCFNMWTPVSWPWPLWRRKKKGEKNPPFVIRLRFKVWKVNQMKPSKQDWY